MINFKKIEAMVLSVFVFSLGSFSISMAQSIKPTQQTTKQTTTTPQKSGTSVFPLKVQPKTTIQPRITTPKITQEEKDQRLRDTYKKLQSAIADQLNTNPKVRNAVFGIITTKSRSEIVNLLNSWMTKVASQPNQRAFENARNQFSFGTLPTNRVGLTSPQTRLAQFGNEGISRLSGIEKSAVFGGLLGIIDGTILGHASIVPGSQTGATLISSISSLVSGGSGQQAGVGGQGGQVQYPNRSHYYAEGGEGGEPSGGDGKGGDTGGGTDTSGGTTGGGMTGGGTPTGGGSVGGGEGEGKGGGDGKGGSEGGAGGGAVTQGYVAAVVSAILGEVKDLGGDDSDAVDEAFRGIGGVVGTPGGGGSDPRGADVVIYFRPTEEGIERVYQIQKPIGGTDAGGGAVERRQESPDGGYVRPSTGLPSVTYPKTQQGVTRPEQYRGSESPDGGGTTTRPPVDVNVRPGQQQPGQCVGEDCI